MKSMPVSSIFFALTAYRSQFVNKKSAPCPMSTAAVVTSRKAHLYIYSTWVTSALNYTQGQPAEFSAGSYIGDIDQTFSFFPRGGATQNFFFSFFFCVRHPSTC
jgi:hypothetical protein